MNGSLYHKWVEVNAMSNWESLGGYLTSSPAATMSGATMDVFARGGSSDLWQKSYNNGWYDWTSIGGTPYHAPPRVVHYRGV